MVSDRSNFHISLKPQQGYDFYLEEFKIVPLQGVASTIHRRATARILGTISAATISSTVVVVQHHLHFQALI